MVDFETFRLKTTSKQVPAKSKNPITEHKVDILERLDPNMKIGRGGSKCKIN